MTTSDWTQTREALMEMGEGYQAIADWAKGVRASLEADGWSPAVAERLAADALMETYRRAMRTS